MVLQLLALSGEEIQAGFDAFSNPKKIGETTPKKDPGRYMELVFWRFFVVNLSKY